MPIVACDTFHIHFILAHFSFLEPKPQLLHSLAFTLSLHHLPHFRTIIPRFQTRNSHSARRSQNSCPFITQCSCQLHFQPQLPHKYASSLRAVSHRLGMFVSLYRLTCTNRGRNCLHSSVCLQGGYIL